MPPPGTVCSGAMIGGAGDDCEAGGVGDRLGQPEVGDEYLRVLGFVIRAAPTQELLGSFTRDRLRVVVRRVTDATAGGLAALPGVASVELASRDHDEATFLIQARAGETDAVQRAVTRYAVETDLTLVTNSPETVDLEEVFLRLIDSKERAA